MPNISLRKCCFCTRLNICLLLLACTNFKAGTFYSTLKENQVTLAANSGRPKTNRNFPMIERTLIKNISIVNEGQINLANILIDNGVIQKIGRLEDITHSKIIDGTGKYLFPGIIDGQVHFRDPGLTHKGDLHSESRAAVVGGVTSFIDMPNTFPNVLTIEILNEKYQIASEKSLANYGFFLGVNGDNLDYVISIDTSKLLGVSDDGLYFTKKGNLLADNPETMEKLFANCKSIIAIHSEKNK